MYIRHIVGRIQKMKMISPTQKVIPPRQNDRKMTEPIPNPESRINILKYFIIFLIGYEEYMIYDQRQQTISKFLPPAIELPVLP